MPRRASGQPTDIMQPSAKSPSQGRQASQKAANRRLGWILLSIVLVFLGFVPRWFLGG
jgi:hypothetical protein